MSRPQFAPRAPHRARAQITAWQQAEPWRAHYWQAVDLVRATHAHRWPRHCYLPIEGAGPIVTDARLATGRPPDAQALVQEVSELATYAAWRVSQGIYRFDATLADALVRTPIVGDLPAAALLRLPEWCVYIETPGHHVATIDGATPLHGYYAWIDTPVSGGDILTLALDTDLPLTTTHVPLVGTLEDAMTAVVDEWQRVFARGHAVRGPHAAYRAAARETLPPLISLLLYLCAEDPDFGGARPTWPVPTRTKHGYRLFPADRVTVWEVGVRLGAALRRAIEAEPAAAHGGGHASPRGHVRRAHWHTFIAGPRKRPDEQERRLKWLPPIPVNVDDVDTLPAVVHPVQPE